MNFYKRWIGDIQRDTGHLSCTEMGVYDRLLDHYYATESALPNDIDACCRIARAMTKDERKAVSSVLNQYFTLINDGYEQGRAEKEIAEAQPAMVSARLNGAKGGRPKKAENITQEKPNGFLNDNPKETQSETSPEPEPEPYIKPIESVEDSNLVELKTEKTHTQIKTSQIVEGLKSIGMMPFNPDLPNFQKLIELGYDVGHFVNAANENRGTGKFNINYLTTKMINRHIESEKELMKKPLKKFADKKYTEGVMADGKF